MLRILVTGAAGFVGAHLVRELRGRGHDVVAAGRSPGQGVDRICDVEDAEGLRQAAEGRELVVHLAVLNMAESRRDPPRAVAVNAVGTVNVLGAAAAAGSRVLYASTGQVYAQGRLPMREEDPTGPDSIYAASKLAGELACHAYEAELGLPVTVLRLANLFESADRPTIEARFARRIAEGKPPEITGDPTDGRDFMHVSDAVAGIVAACESASTGTFNLGTGRLTTLAELAHLCASTARLDVEPELAPPTGSSLRFALDSSKAEQAFGFRAATSLEDGLAALTASARP